MRNLDDLRTTYSDSAKPFNNYESLKFYTFGNSIQKVFMYF